MTDADADVTVLVVCYNHENFVVDTLESIAGQTRPPARVVIIDDASRDRSVAVIRAWLESSDMGYELVAHRDNTGLCRALNEGLGTVATPLYTYISADDRMRPDRLEQQVARWRDDGSSAVAVYSNARRIDARGKDLIPDYRTLHQWPRSDLLEGDIHTALLRHCWMPAASVMVVTEAVRNVGGYDERWFFEDYDLWLRLAAQGRFLVVDEPLVDFRELDDSLGHERFKDDDIGFLEARVGIFLKQVGVSSEGDDYIRAAMAPLAIRLWKLGGDPMLVRDAFQQASAIRGSQALRLRLLLIDRGIKQQPAWLTAVERGVQHARHRLRTDR